MTKKKVYNFRLSGECVEALAYLHEAFGGSKTNTQLVEEAIINMAYYYKALDGMEDDLK